MSDAAELIVGLRYDALDIRAPHKMGMREYGHGYEISDVYLENKINTMEFQSKTLRPEESIDCEKREDSCVIFPPEDINDIYGGYSYYPDTIIGFKIAETWNGYIDVEEDEIRERIVVAKNEFKRLTNKEAHVIFISTQN